MSVVSHFAYAQARMQARYGARIGEAAWQPLQSRVDLAAFLEQARAGALRPWIANIAAATPAHEIEELLRTQLRARIAEAARWVPREWRAAVRWTATLMVLPDIAHLLAGEEAPAWMRDDPVLGEIARAEPGRRAGALAAGPLAALAHGAPALRERWLAEWRRRLPARPPGLDDLVREIDAHREAFVHPQAGSWPARRAFEARLARFFRRAFLSPAAVFAWLLLQALELERLRAEILRRAWFPEGGA
jgi:hypothetical protein